MPKHISYEVENRPEIDVNNPPKRWSHQKYEAREELLFMPRDMLDLFTRMCKTAEVPFNELIQDMGYFLMSLMYCKQEDIEYTVGPHFFKKYLREIEEYQGGNLEARKYTDE